jgi:hypothetical protein
MTTRCCSRESRRRVSFRYVQPVLALGLLLGCSAMSVDKPNGAGAESSGGASTTAGSPSFGGGLVVTGANARCNDGSLRCQKVDCPADSSPSTTSVSGVVYDPAGRVPLYNAVVYVVDPSDQVTLGERAQCESCSAHFPKKGVLAAALTKADGSFRLTDVPAGKKVPLVIQLGKWRREIEIGEVVPCTDNPLRPDQTRLPRNSTEGHLPKIAVTTGGSDALECLLKKIGVDVAEFTSDSGTGRVNLFSGYRAAKSIIVNGSRQPLRTAEDLWASSDRMLDYDMILMGCEGEGSLWKPQPTPDDPAPLPRPVSMQLEVRKYADMGGRIFGSHWHHRWINSDGTTPDDPYPPAGPPIASFAKSAGRVPDLTVSVDASFPKGRAFSEWLLKVGASKEPGQLPLTDIEHTVDSVDPTVARRWIYGTDMAALEAGSNRSLDMVQYFSFTTPVGAAAECGRMVFIYVNV